MMKEKTRNFRRLINCALKAEKKRGRIGKVRVYFTNAQNIRELNQRFRRINRSTDVLSFSVDDKDDLGEIVIEEKEKNKEKLVLHGLLHLLGYDHKKEKDRVLMRAKEEKYKKWV